MSVANALKKIDGAFPAYNKRKGIGHHATLEEVKSVCGDKLQGNETVFTVVRNPYDVLVSMFLRNRNVYLVRFHEKRLGRDFTLQEFVDLWVQLNQPPSMKDGRLFYHDARVHLRYERLEVELSTLFRRLPNIPTHAKAIQLAPENKTPEKDHWSTYYDDPTYAFVNSKFSDEIVKFGYPFMWSNKPLA